MIWIRVIKKSKEKVAAHGEEESEWKLLTWVKRKWKQLNVVSFHVSLNSLLFIEPPFPRSYTLILWGFFLSFLVLYGKIVVLNIVEDMCVKFKFNYP